MVDRDQERADHHGKLAGAHHDGALGRDREPTANAAHARVIGT
jgi:hypothetical protein